MHTGSVAIAQNKVSLGVLRGLHRNCEFLSHVEEKNVSLPQEDLAPFLENFPVVRKLGLNIVCALILS